MCDALAAHDLATVRPTSAIVATFTVFLSSSPDPLTVPDLVPDSLLARVEAALHAVSSRASAPVASQLSPALERIRAVLSSAGDGQGMAEGSGAVKGKRRATILEENPDERVFKSGVVGAEVASAVASLVSRRSVRSALATRLEC